MALKFPESADECVYFTRRAIGTGHATVWVYREKCPKCKKSLMGKPRGDDGSIKIRAKEYVCPDCNNTIEKKEYEESLTANIQYTCPSCGNTGEKQVPYKRKKVKGIEMLQFTCDKCNAKIDVTKKMKAKKEAAEQSKK
ncbi:MAG: hypothetical protein Q8O89_00295 [Nanoarchaeota archaeon]|nr:hypothetical protein [Nanoarchaeota archaeon]